MKSTTLKEDPALRIAIGKALAVEALWDAGQYLREHSRIFVTITHEKVVQVLYTYFH